jgi:hypothetical protein
MYEMHLALFLKAGCDTRPKWGKGGERKKKVFSFSYFPFSISLISYMPNSPIHPTTNKKGA